jgi:transcriptional regulator with XRE-family HTH domain
MNMDRRTLGQRVAYWRAQRGLTQQELADRLGRPRNWVWKVESGSVGSLERSTTLATVADALSVDIQVLLGREIARNGADVDCLDAETVEAIRTALERYDAIGGLLARPQPVEPVPLAALRADVDYAWAAFERGGYGVLGRTLPHLLVSAQEAWSAYEGEGAQEAASLLAQAYQVAASTLRKLGENHLGWLAADRAIRAAAESGDVGWHGVATFRVGNALLALGRTDAAAEIQLQAANRLTPAGPAEAGHELLSVYGIVLLQGAMACARKGDSATVADLLREAETVGSHVGDGHNHYRTSFGPSNVGIHRVSTAVELGEGALAVQAHESIPRQALELLPRERRANHFLDVARGYYQWRKIDRAAEFLVEADRLAPAEVRCRPGARAILAELSRRGRVDNLPPPLRDIALSSGMPE